MKSESTTRLADDGAHPRLLVISNMWPSEGNAVFGSFVERHVRGLREAGADVVVVANTDPRRGPRYALMKYTSLSRRARRAARSGHYDAVVGHFLYPTAAFAEQAARVADAPLVLVSHGTDARSVMRGDRFARNAREALAGADLVIAVSESLGNALRTDVGVPEAVPIEVVNMGYDDSIFVPDPGARDALRLEARERVVLFVGNLEPVKGVDVLVEAFERLVAGDAADTLVIVGSGSQEVVISEMLSGRSDGGSRLKGRVRLTGPLGQAELAMWMSAADVLALPSRSEGLGIVLLEAMACGTPCVASAVGGVPEVLDDSCGRLVQSDDPAALAVALTDVLALGKDPFRDACIDRASGHTYTKKAVEFLEHVGKAVNARGVAR